MLEAEDILNGLIRGALGGRRKPWRHTGRALQGGSLINAGTILAAAGVAWGLYETWQQQQQTQPPAPGAAAPVSLPPSSGTPPPLPGTLPAPAVPAPMTSALPVSILQLLRLMVSAARADGEIGPAERERILAEAREVGAEAEVVHELEARRPVAEIVASATDPGLREQLYALAYTIVRADEEVTGGERLYLAQLAHCLDLDTAAVARCEAQVTRRIDAARTASD